MLYGLVCAYKCAFGHKFTPLLRHNKKKKLEIMFIFADIYIYTVLVKS